MARIVCEYCGTEYDDNMPRCPLCGTVNEAVAEEEPEEEVRPARRRVGSRGGARVAPGSDRIPKWIIALICVVLGIAVVIGALYAMYAMGVFSPNRDQDEDTNLALPVTDGTVPDTTADPNGDTSAPQEPAGPTGSDEVLCVSVVVTPDVIHLANEGDSQAVTATVLPAECTEPVAWISSDESVCTVDADGMITAIDGGEATVTVSCGTVRKDIEVHCDFLNSQVNNASLSTTDFTVKAVGEQAVLEILNPPRDAEVTWTSSDTSICTVTGGVVTAVGRGTATITANVNGKELTCIARCDITGQAQPNLDNAENNPSAGGNQLDHTDVSLGVGESFEISVVNGISGGWNVTDGTIISVNGNGIVTALASGTAKVYTVVGGERLECIVRVH